MNKPFVSIIIPTYNRDQFIGETLDSVKNQIYKNWECIIVDDGSEDNSLQIVEEYCRKDPRFKLYQRPAKTQKGASACRNYGLKMAVGHWIQFLDSDDLLDEVKISGQIENRGSEKTLLTCRWGGFINSKDLKSRFKYGYHSYRSFKKGISLLNTFGLYNEYFPPHVYLTPRKLINKAGPWNENLSNNDDAEFFTRVILNAADVRFLEKSKVYYRYHSNNRLSDINSEPKLQSFIKSLELIEHAFKKKNIRSSKFYLRRSRNNVYEFLKKNPDIGIKGFEEVLKERKSYSGLGYDLLRKILKYVK